MMGCMMSYLLVCMGLLIISIFNYKRDKNLYAPNQLLCLYWGIQVAVIVPVCGFSTWKYSGLFWLVYAVFSFAVAFIIARGKDKYELTGLPYKKTMPYSFLYGILFVTGLGIVTRLVSIIYLNELSVSDVLFHLSNVSQHLYAVKSGGGEKSNIISRLSLVFLYAFPMFAGYYHSVIRHKLISWVGMALIAYIALILGTKSVFITSCVLWVSGWLTAYIEANKTVPWKYSIKFIYGMAGLLIILLLAMFIRIYGYPGYTIPRALNYMHTIFGNYAIAHLLAFDHWYNSFYWDTFTGGQYTFFGIFNALGLAERLPGIYRDVLYIGSLNTNVYTVFRSLITDFSPVGALAFMAVFGIISGSAYRRLLNGTESSPLAVTVCVMGYSFILWSFVTSIFAYSSYICAFAVFYFGQKLINWELSGRNGS